MKSAQGYEWVDVVIKMPNGEKRDWKMINNPASPIKVGSKSHPDLGFVVVEVIGPVFVSYDEYKKMRGA